jgi:hypothetical protein
MIAAPDRVVNAPEREHWDDHKNSRDALDVLVISSRPFRSDLSIEFKSRILVDENFELGRAFAANGTPSAVLVGPDGMIAGEVTVGGKAVMQVINGETKSRDIWSIDIKHERRRHDDTNIAPRYPTVGV